MYAFDLWTGNIQNNIYRYIIIFKGHSIKFHSQSLKMLQKIVINHYT